VRAEQRNYGLILMIWPMYEPISH